MTTTGCAAACGARALVLVDPGVDSVPFGSESSRTIGGADGHHLQRARRLEIGEVVVVADGEGAWYPATVTAAGDGTITVARTAEVAREPEAIPRLTVAFTPARADHGSDVVHQLVELGVDAIAVLQTERSVVRWDGPRAAKQLARLRRVVREAAMQSHRARVPEVTGPFAPGHWIDRPGVVVADRGGAASIADLVLEHADLAVLVGPEGGFAVADLRGLEDAPRVGVGVHTLRSVTAPAALAAAFAGHRHF